MIEIPSDWSIETLGEITEIKASNIDKKIVADQKLILVCNYTDVVTNSRITRRVNFLRSSATPAQIKTFSLSRNDILLTKDAEVGRVSIVDDQITDLVCGYHLYQLRTSAKEVIPEYLLCALQSFDIQTYFKKQQTGTTIAGLSRSALDATRIPLPPLPEQRKIAEIFLNLDNLIDKIDQKINKTQKILIATTHDLLTKGIGHKKFKETTLGKIPFEWNLSKLGDYIDLLTDYHSNGSYEKLKQHVKLLDSFNHAIMIRTKNLENNDYEDLIYIDKFAYQFLNKSKVFADDILMNKIANPGVVYLMPQLNQPVSLGMNLFLIRMSKKVCAKYIFYFLKANENYVKSFASGTSTKTITKQEVRDLSIVLPPLKEQLIISRIISSFENQIDYLQSKLVLFKSLKKSLSSDLLTGRKRVEV